ncbi:hypothetical protein NFI96_023007, partial [Prochilodus magdalenae]
MRTEGVTSSGRRSTSGRRVHNAGLHARSCDNGLNHHVTVAKDCSGVVPDCHGVTQNGSGSSSVTSPALVLVETPNESVCGGTVVSAKMNGTGVKNDAPEEEQGHGEKRKRDGNLEDTQVDEKNKAEKKVCKGFPHFHTNSDCRESVFGVCDTDLIVWFVFVCVCSCLCAVSGLAKLKGFVAARRGEREEMQDAHVLLPDLGASVQTLPAHVSRLAYFAVFDGHGGARASQHAAENLHHTLISKFPKGEVENLDKLVKKCLLDSFRQTDEDFLKKASSQKPAWKDGSTATCLLAVDDVLYVANLGDSRVYCVVLRQDRERRGGKKSCVTLALSKEHNPTIYEERMRIQRAGGTVRSRWPLAGCVGKVSRSIGDGSVYSAAESIANNQTYAAANSAPRNRFLSFSTLPRMSAWRGKEGQTSKGSESFTRAACQRLAVIAVRRGCADNVTVILISIEISTASDSTVYKAGLNKTICDLKKVLQGSKVLQSNCLRQFNQGLQEMIQFHTMLLDQSQRAITQQLTHLLSQFLPQIRETQREFVRIGGDVELAAMKNAQISPHKPAEAEKTSHLLLATRKCFQHFALDYCLQ